MPQDSLENPPSQEVRHDATVPEIAEKSTPLWKIAIPTLVIVLVGVFGVNYFATSNADYICTRVVETEGVCTNGAWGDWQTISTTTANNIETSTQQRVYTGTRILSRAVEYLNLRTSCADGFTQEAYGSANGASGFHGGNVITTTQVCQIAQDRTVTRNLTTGDQSQTVAVVTAQTYGDTQEEIVSIDSFDDISGTLLDARRDAIALELNVDPNLVAPNSAVSVQWTSVEMTRCQVAANGNNDIWGSLLSDEATLLLGDKTSGAITQETVYTLKCIDFEGNEHEISETVRIIPAFEEF